MERLYFIVNPTAGADRAGDAFCEVRAMLDEMNMDYSFDYTQYKGHATELAVDAVKRGGEVYRIRGRRRYPERGCPRAGEYRFRAGVAALRHGQ